MTGAEGERKRGLYADVSFGDWQQSKTGDPSVVITAASSPMRGAKMVRTLSLRRYKTFAAKRCPF